MGELVEIDRDAVARRIASACARFPEVAAAFLFGSVLGPSRPDSDIDVGLIRRSQPGESRYEAFKAGLGLEVAAARAIGAVAGHRIDVTVLDEERPIFAMTVLRQGRLCYVGSQDAFTDFLEHVAQAYRENGPRHKAALDEVLAEPVGRGGH